MPTSLPKPVVFIFDFFGVIVGFDNDLLYSRLARHCRDPELAFKRIDGLMSSHDIITRKRTLPQIYEALVADHGLSLAYSGFVNAWLEPYSWPIPGMAELIRILSSNYKLVLLSNVDAYYWQAIRPAHPELNCFDTLLLSCDLGMAKPTPSIFKHACQVAGADPSRCLFVDDTLKNVEAAQALGLQAHRFTGRDDFLMELEARNIRGLQGRS